MDLREKYEAEEIERLSEYACKACESKGRAVPENKSEIRTEFQRDRDRIIHSKSLRRLMHKTQVFLAPEGDHFRTRLTHTLEVSQIARSISKGLDLNEDLTEAIALGHDLGHTPFGHIGETFLNERYPGGFRHNEQSLRVVDVIDRNSDGRPMNLTAEVRDGIVNHTGPTIPFTLEGQVVRFSDRIAYINHDIDDAIGAGIISRSDLPEDCVKVLGVSHGKRIDFLVKDLIAESTGKSAIAQSEEASFYMSKLRDFMFENVYRNPRVRVATEVEKIEHLVNSLYDYYLKHLDQIPDEYKFIIERDGAETAVKDHIAGMTDRYAINESTRLFVPAEWSVIK